MKREHVETFVRKFLTRVTAIGDDIARERFTRETPRILRARIHATARDEGHASGVHHDAWEVLATYVCETITLDGRTLAEAERNGLLGTHDYDPTRRYNRERNTNGERG